MMATPTLISYDLELVQETSYTRISRCSAFYSPSPRKWLRATLSIITVSVDSPYWDLIYVNTVDMKWGNEGWFLPKRLNSSFQRLLNFLDYLKQDTEVSFYLGPGTYQPPKLQVEANHAPAQFEQSLLEVTSILHHWHCPKYPESDIARRTLHRCPKQTGSIACIGSQWALLTLFTACKSDFDSNLYNMQISHYFHNTPGISRLPGLVYDQDDGYSTGYPSEMATNPVLGHALTPQTQLDTVLWQRREKRCWQIVSIVASLHNSGFLAGTLVDPIRDMLGVDANGDLFCRAQFNIHFFCNESMAFVVPPECRTLAIFYSTRRSLPASPSTDLYQLGLLVWRVANDLKPVLSSTFCELAGCNTSPEKLCTEPTWIQLAYHP